MGSKSADFGLSNGPKRAPAKREVYSKDKNRKVNFELIVGSRELKFSFRELTFQLPGANFSAPGS